MKKINKRESMLKYCIYFLFIILVFHFSNVQSAGIKPGSLEDLIVNIGDRVFFGYDSAELDADAQELLQDQVAWIRKYDVKVVIEGHADERTSFDYALALGEKRAQAVKNFLIREGVSPTNISTITYGSERPAVVGSNDGAWSQNRRAVTTVVK